MRPSKIERREHHIYALAVCRSLRLISLILSTAWVIIIIIVCSTNYYVIMLQLLIHWFKLIINLLDLTLGFRCSKSTNFSIYNPLEGDWRFGRVFFWAWSGLWLFTPGIGTFAFESPGVRCFWWHVSPGTIKHSDICFGSRKVLQKASFYLKVLLAKTRCFKTLKLEFQGHTSDFSVRSYIKQHKFGYINDLPRAMRSEADRSTIISFRCLRLLNR